MSCKNDGDSRNWERSTDFDILGGRWFARVRWEAKGILGAGRMETRFNWIWFTLVFWFFLTVLVFSNSDDRIDWCGVIVWSDSMTWWDWLDSNWSFIARTERTRWESLGGRGDSLVFNEPERSRLRFLVLESSRDSDEGESFVGWETEALRDRLRFLCILPSEEPVTWCFSSSRPHNISLSFNARAFTLFFSFLRPVVLTKPNDMSFLLTHTPPSLTQAIGTSHTSMSSHTRNFSNSFNSFSICFTSFFGTPSRRPSLNKQFNDTFFTSPFGPFFSFHFTNAKSFHPATWGSIQEPLAMRFGVIIPIRL